MIASINDELLLQVFVLTVVFGLFHGLLLFPSLLAMLGPQNRSDMLICTSILFSSLILFLSLLAMLVAWDAKQVVHQHEAIKHHINCTKKQILTRIFENKKSRFGDFKSRIGATSKCTGHNVNIARGTTDPGYNYSI